MSYNEEVVFKLSAKDVNDKLIKVRNRPEIAKRRWFWELLGLQITSRQNLFACRCFQNYYFPRSFYLK